MHITETTIHDTRYCYAAECIWNPETKKNDKPSKAVGKLDAESRFHPNKFLSDILARCSSASDNVSEYEQKIIDTVKAKYGEDIQPREFTVRDDTETTKVIETASIVHHGPQLVFESITLRFKLRSLLRNAFGEDLAQDILSLAWYITSEGNALSNNDSWLDYFENPRGYGFSSQEVSKLLDHVGYDGIMTFYKQWLKHSTSSDKILYDLTSISYYGIGINRVDWGYNRDHEDLPQVNYALLCVRRTGMPLFAWPLAGSITDVSTLEDTLLFLEKLGYKPNCLMLDRAFSCVKNIVYMLRRKYIFLQALKVNAKWVFELIDAGEVVRNRPDSMLVMEERTYFVSTTAIQWVRVEKKNGKEDSFFRAYKGKGDRYKPQSGEKILEEHSCKAHVLFCYDLIGNSWIRFMENLHYEYQRLVCNPGSTVKGEYKPYFLITMPKYARKRTIDFNMAEIEKHKNKYAGYICFLTNDPTITTAEDALREYSTRDYIEKDFDEMKNGLDMSRIRVHTDERMRARLFIQLLAEIYLREIRLRLRESDDCRKMTKAQIFSHIKAIHKIHFKGKYKDVVPSLSKNQRCILDALEIPF